MMNSQSKTVLSIGNAFDDLPPPKPAENIKNQRKNKPPPDSLLDDQPMTWRQRELRELASKSKETTTKKRNRKTTAKNSLSAQAEKLGYHQRPLEDPDKLINRISRDANKAINDEMIKARFGTAGRDVKEIGKEYETLDKKLKRRRKKY